MNPSGSAATFTHSSAGRCNNVTIVFPCLPSWPLCRYSSGNTLCIRINRQRENELQHSQHLRCLSPKSPGSLHYALCTTHQRQSCEPALQHTNMPSMSAQTYRTNRTCTNVCWSIMPIRWFQLPPERAGDCVIGSFVASCCSSSKTRSVVLSSSGSSTRDEKRWISSGTNAYAPTPIS